jgi:predicted oxidoreductase
MYELTGQPLARASALNQIVVARDRGTESSLPKDAQVTAVDELVSIVATGFGRQRFCTSCLAAADRGPSQCS